MKSPFSNVSIWPKPLRQGMLEILDSYGLEILSLEDFFELPLRPFSISLADSSVPAIKEIELKGYDITLPSRTDSMIQLAGFLYCKNELTAFDFLIIDLYCLLPMDLASSLIHPLRGPEWHRRNHQE